eukprot:gene3771-5438_t
MVLVEEVDDDIARNPFLFTMAVEMSAHHGALRLDESRRGPRWHLAELWMRKSAQDREARHRPQLPKGVALWDAVRLVGHAIVVGMRTDDVWNCTVGRALEWCEGGGREAVIQYKFAELGISELGLDKRTGASKQDGKSGYRDIMGCLPLRIQNIEDDTARVFWRHKFLSEVMLADVVLRNLKSIVPVTWELLIDHVLYDAMAAASGSEMGRSDGRLTQIVKRAAEGAAAHTKLREWEQTVEDERYEQMRRDEDGEWRDKRGFYKKHGGDEYEQGSR